MKKLWAALIILSVIGFTLPLLAEQPQPPQQAQPKNYEALIAEDGRQRCESNLAIVLRQVDELKAKNQKLENQLAELQKPKPEQKPEAKKDEPK